MPTANIIRIVRIRVIVGIVSKVRIRVIGIVGVGWQGLAGAGQH